MTTDSKSMMNAPRAAGVAMGLGLALTASVCQANDTAAAQALFEQGKRALARHAYDEACPKFEESYRLDPALGALLNLADCYEREGKLATAWGKFVELAEKARAVGQTERAYIGRERAATLAPRLSNLEIDVPQDSRVDGLEVRRDLTPLGPAEWNAAIPADAGAHTVSATAPGHLPWSQSVTVVDGATIATLAVPLLQVVPTASVEPVNSPNPSPDTKRFPGGTAAPLAPEGHSGSAKPQKTIGVVVAAVGVVGLGVGGTFGILSLLKHNSATSVCPGTTCNSADDAALWDQARALGNVSTVAFVVGGVAVVTGVLLWWTAPAVDGRETPAVRVGAGLGSLRMEGTW